MSSKPGIIRLRGAILFVLAAFIALAAAADMDKTRQKASRYVRNEAILKRKLLPVPRATWVLFSDFKMAYRKERVSVRHAHRRMHRASSYIEIAKAHSDIMKSREAVIYLLEETKGRVVDMAQIALGESRILSRENLLSLGDLQDLQVALGKSRELLLGRIENGSICEANIDWSRNLIPEAASVLSTRVRFICLAENETERQSLITRLLRDIQRLDDGILTTIDNLILEAHSSPQLIKSSRLGMMIEMEKLIDDCIAYNRELNASDCQKIKRLLGSAECR